MAIMTDPVVEIAQGKLKGVKQGRLLVFRGVPYAQADKVQAATALAPMVRRTLGYRTRANLSAITFPSRVCDGDRKSVV